MIDKISKKELMEKQDLLNDETYIQIIEKLQNFRLKKQVDILPNGKVSIMSQRLLSSKIKKKTRFISEIEDRKKELDLVTFVDICNALDITSNSVLAEFIFNDLDENSFSNLNFRTKLIIHNFIINLDNSSQDTSNNKTSTIKFDKAVLGQRIRNCRTSKNYSTRELGKKLNKAHGYISNVENGISNISISALIDICNALQCTPNDLLQPFIDNKSSNNDYSSLCSSDQKVVDTLISTFIDDTSCKVGYAPVTTTKMTKEDEERINKLINQKHKSYI